MGLSEELASELRKATTVVKSGGIILYPTDTVWGIGCDATNKDAVAKIYRLKRRADSKSMLSLVSSSEMLTEWLESFPDEAREIIAEAKSPLTIIYDRPKGFAENLTADDGSAGIRIANDEFCKLLCENCGVPVVSTSANISGSPTPEFFCEISEEIKDGVDYIVRLRQDDTTSAPPSRIVKITDSGNITIIR